MHGEGHKHADHEHGHRRFANPEERAEKWNSPDRDAWQCPQEIISALGLRPSSTVADIGAGTGYMVAHLSEAVGERGTVIAIDAEEAMIAYLGERSERLGPAKVIPRLVGAAGPELGEASVDGVITIDVWHHIDGRENYAKSIYRGLKSGGRFVIVESKVDAEIGPPVEMRLEPTRVMKELEAGGFRVELVRTSMPRHYMVMGYKD